MYVLFFKNLVHKLEELCVNKYYANIIFKIFFVKTPFHLHV